MPLQDGRHIIFRTARQGIPDYKPPALEKEAFHCPHCSIYAQQFWSSLHRGPSISSNIQGFAISLCGHCDDIAIWKNKEMIFPLSGNAPLPNPDMPESIKEIYIEARNVVTLSPRSACVLLRLCVESICNGKIDNSGDLNSKIKKLVQLGLNERIKEAWDTVRVIGGEAAHTLKMNLKDDSETAIALLHIVNNICDWAYTSEKRIDDLYGNLPQSKKTAIDKRDGKTGSQT